jgi:hypothetical protein
VIRRSRMLFSRRCIAWTYFICKDKRDVTPEDISKVAKHLDGLVGAGSAWTKQANRVSERVVQFARQTNRVTEEVNRAATVNADLIANVGNQLAAFEAKAFRGSESFARRISSFQSITANLDAAQRNRVNRVVDDWQGWARANQPAKRQGFLERVRQWLFGRQRQSGSFERYLVDAHVHPAVARRDGRGRRWWFEAWRREALVLLHLGLDLREFEALRRSIPVRPRRRNELRPAPRPIPIFSDFLSRIQTVIAPNAPGSNRLHTAPVFGDGFALTT